MDAHIEPAKEFAAKIRVFKRATSLGSVESLAEHRASVEGPGTRCPTDLVRLLERWGGLEPFCGELGWLGWVGGPEPLVHAGLTGPPLLAGPPRVGWSGSATRN